MHRPMWSGPCLLWLKEEGGVFWNTDSWRLGRGEYHLLPLPLAWFQVPLRVLKGRSDGFFPWATTLWDSEPIPLSLRAQVTSLSRTQERGIPCLVNSELRHLKAGVLAFSYWATSSVVGKGPSGHWWGQDTGTVRADWHHVFLLTALKWHLQLPGPHWTLDSWFPPPSPHLLVRTVILKFWKSLHH